MKTSPKPTSKEALARRADALRVLLRWHRRIGITATLFVITLVTTGILLNHVDDLALDKVTVKSRWLMAHYGLAPEAAPVGVDIGGEWVTWVDGTVYVAEGGGQPLATLIGAARSPSFVVAASTDRILLMTPDGELVETIDRYLLPGRINAIGLAESGDVVVRTGTERFASNISLSAWTPLGERAVFWSTVQEPPESVREAALQRFRGVGMPLDRVLLDIHSGHIFGFWGALIVDLAAALFLVLAATGIVVTLRRNNGTRVGGNGREP